MALAASPAAPVAVLAARARRGGGGSGAGAGSRGSESGRARKGTDQPPVAKAGAAAVSAAATAGVTVVAMAAVTAEADGAAEVRDGVEKTNPVEERAIAIARRVDTRGRRMPDVARGPGPRISPIGITIERAGGLTSKVCKIGCTRVWVVSDS